MEFRRALVVAPNWIGDLLMAQPLLAQLAARHPQMKIDLLVPAHIAPLAALIAQVDQVIPTQFAHGGVQWRARWQLAQTLKRQRYDACWVLPNSAKSALVPWLAGIGLRIGYRGEHRFGLLHIRHQPPQGAEREPMVAHYARLARRPGAPLPDPLPDPQLRVAPARIAEVATKYQIAPGKPLIVLCPGAEYGPAKRWPAEYFVQLAELVQQSFPYAQIVVLGGPKDHEIGAQIAAGAPGVRNLCGETRLDEAAALLARAEAAICNDSGLMHVCAALNRPQIAIFGSSDPRHTPPHSDRATVFWLKLDCSPCFARECPQGHLRCLREIAPAEVFVALRQLLLPAARIDA